MSIYRPDRELNLDLENQQIKLASLPQEKSKIAQDIEWQNYLKDNNLDGARRVDLVRELEYTKEPLKTKAFLERCLHDAIIAEDRLLIDQYLQRYNDHIKKIKQEITNKYENTS